MTTSLPWPSSPTPTDRFHSQGGYCPNNLLTPSGRCLSWASCQQLPVHRVLGWASLGSQIGRRNSPSLLTHRPQSETPAQGLASLSLGRQFVLYTPQLTLQTGAMDWRSPAEAPTKVVQGSRPRPAILDSAEACHQLFIPVWGCILELIRQSPCRREEPACNSTPTRAGSQGLQSEP